MGVRSSDIMAFTAILAGAGAGYGLTNLYAHSQQDEAPEVAELTTVVETEVPRVDVEVEPVRVDVETFRVRVEHSPTVVVTTAPHVITMMHMKPHMRSHVVVETAPHIVTRMRWRRPDQGKIEEIRREDNVRFSERVAFQEALSSLESLEALKTLGSLDALQSLDALKSLDNLENVVNLEALEQALEELERELEGVMTIDVDVLDDADDQHKKKKRKKRRIIVKRPGNDGSGG